MRFWYFVAATKGAAVIEYGWMLAADDNELVTWARAMGYGIDIAFLGEAMPGAVLSIVPGTESPLARRVFETGGRVTPLEAALAIGGGL